MPGLMARLLPEQAVTLFHRFFSPYCSTYAGEGGERES
jgi:hypothetical protein